MQEVHQQADAGEDERDTGFAPGAPLASHNPERSWRGIPLDLNASNPSRSAESLISMGGALGSPSRVSGVLTDRSGPGFRDRYGIEPLVTLEAMP